MRSTLSSLTNFSAFCRARVVSDASSSTMNSTFCPAIVVGTNWNVLRSGMPSDAAGPVADTVTPTLTCAWAGSAAAPIAAATAAAASRRFFILLDSSL